MLARLIYYSLKHGTQYVQQGMEQYEAKLREQRLKNLARAARELGLTLNPVAA